MIKIYIKFITTLLLSCSFILAQESKQSSFSIVAFGDMPYFLPQDYARFDNVIKTINELKPAFTVNVGDFKSSSTPCNEEAFNKMLNYYSQFEQPMIYTPGDNEWTDCTKKEAGSYDAEERLEVIRKLFFKDNLSFGKQKIKYLSESDTKEYSKYVENNFWEYNTIAFSTIHIVGSNNNFLPTSKNGNKEYFEREKANLFWIEKVFSIAKEKNLNAIVLVTQADMFGAKDSKESSGFTLLKQKIESLTKDFKKPVLLINGDSHVFLIDKPILEDSKTKKALQNFTRLQVPGESNMHLVKILVSPSSKNIFQFEELNVIGN